jgi:FKBP-type peptidyl-prolyl cis-trans isomerase
MRLVIASLLLIGVSACTGCKSNGNQSTEVQHIPTQDALIERNKQAARDERSNIDEFIASKGWDMKQTGTGLHYQFIQKGDSTLPTAQYEQEALVKTQVELLNGDLIYTTDHNGPQWFKVGKSDVESGLHEGILLMRVGDKARFIMPSHLAHGLVGDFKAIPPRSTLVYEVELMDLK